MTVHRDIPKGQYNRVCEAIGKFHTSLENPLLWEHQNTAIVAVSTFLDESVDRIASGENVSGAIVMPTGSGKTVLAAELSNRLGLRSLIVAPTSAIVLQHREELSKWVPQMKTSVYYADEKNLEGQIILTTYNSLVSLFGSGNVPDDLGVVFYDEAHHSLSPKRLELHGNLAPLEIGLTATPAFNPSKHILRAFENVIYEMDLREAIELGILAPLRGFIVETALDLKNVKLRIGRNLLNEAEADKHLNILARNISARNFYIDGFRGTPAVAFCVTKDHAEKFAKLLNESNVKAAYIHSGLSNKERERRLSDFEDGSIDVLTSRDVLVEGWDSKRVILEAEPEAYLLAGSENAHGRQGSTIAPR